MTRARRKVAKGGPTRVGVSVESRRLADGTVRCYAWFTQSRDGGRLLLKDLVADHYLPSICGAAPTTRKNDSLAPRRRYGHPGP